MRTFRGPVLPASILSFAGATMADPADARRPMYPFIGAWTGIRAGAEGPIKVTRTYASAATNHHLEITEKNGGGAPAAVWGMVSFDARLGDPLRAEGLTERYCRTTTRLAPRVLPSNVSRTR